MPCIQMGIVKFYHLIYSRHFTDNICIRLDCLKNLNDMKLFQDLSLPYLIQRPCILRVGKKKDIRHSYYITEECVIFDSIIFESRTLIAVVTHTHKHTLRDKASCPQIKFPIAVTFFPNVNILEPLSLYAFQMTCIVTG